MISVTVMAHPLRRARAENLARTLNATIIWDQRNNEWDTGSRAIAAHNPDATHHIVLQDDAIPVRGFLDHASAAITQHPHNLISFYLGRSRPPRWQPKIRAATVHADRQHASWISAHKLLHGVGIAIPTTDIPALLDWCTTSELPYDERIGAWYQTQDRDVLYSWPSLLDHADTPTLVNHADGQPRQQPRTAWRHGTPQQWDTNVVRMR